MMARQEKRTGRPAVEAVHDGEDLSQEYNTAQELLKGMSRVIKGKPLFLERVLTVFAAGGHLLVEDFPGLGKTTAARALASLVADPERDSGGFGDSSDENRDENRSVSFRRIQFTPDLLPYDITGVEVYDQGSGNFEFRPGPVFSHILLADEVNRTTPKVQSALLEVMAESQVTVGNRTRYLDPLFFVIATQNPIEMEGTYPLPAAQMDRFMMRLALGYPDRKEELAILEGRPAARVLPKLKPVCTHGEVLELRRRAEDVYIDPRLMDLIISIAEATREHRDVHVGVSPRGGLMLAAAARAQALIRGRSWVADQDIKDLAPAVLAHRLVTSLDTPAREVLIEEVTARAMEGLSA